MLLLDYLFKLVGYS